MAKTFLFRLDGAPENDAFLELARSQGSIVYAGSAMTLERGWVPDFVETIVEDDGGCSVTLIELEAARNAALVSARKYLPEPSKSILLPFRQYLERVLGRCRSTADPRVDDIQDLHKTLANNLSIIRLWTAAALRQPPQIIEKLLLMDQEHGSDRPMTVSAKDETEPCRLEGDVVLSARLHKNLSRTILILDAVVRGWDRSDATLRAWRNLRSQPLRREVREHPEQSPALASLLIGEKSGVQLTISDAARELSTIWKRFQPERHSEHYVMAALREFLPINMRLDPNAPARIAFEKARHILAEDAFQQIGASTGRI